VQWIERRVQPAALLCRKEPRAACSTAKFRLVVLHEIREKIRGEAPITLLDIDSPIKHLAGACSFAGCSGHRYQLPEVCFGIAIFSC